MVTQQAIAWVVGALVVGLVGCAARTKAHRPRVPAATFCVATDGDDGWSGTLPAPNGAGADGPFATLVRARNAVRARFASTAEAAGCGSAEPLRMGILF